MSYKVLIVDDSRLARMAVIKTLIDLYPDWTRVEAANADEAMVLVKEGDVDLALLDYNMPGRDGLALAGDLRTISPTMPIAVISANHQVEIVAGARAVGATFLAKPLAPQPVADFFQDAERQLKSVRRESAAPDILDELELDALTELVNIGVSAAAASLREMIGEQVHLSVPNLSLLHRLEAVEILQTREANKLVAVHQVFEGDITGRVLLIFPEARSLELVRAVIGGDLALEDIIELEQEALAETGNIILNGCLATIANLLKRSLKMSLPEVLRGDASVFFQLAPPPAAGDTVMFLYINFAIRQRDIDGYIMMLMDLPSLEALKILLDQFIERTTGVARAPVGAPRTDAQS